MSIYEEHNIPTLINAAGEKTWLGGSQMPPEVLAAIKEASESYATIQDVEAGASELISEITGSEAGYVSSGAAAGITLATAACITGMDVEKMNELPDTEGTSAEVVIPKSHRNSYDHAVRAAGAQLIEAGLDDVNAGSGTRSVESWEVEAKIGPDTVAIHALAKSDNHDFLRELVEISQSHEVPFILDAAAQLPPKKNLQLFVSMGVDVVVFSGGKAIRGPQGTGIICGTEEIVQSIALQHLDMDVLFDLWEPPRNLISKEELPGLPRHGIGRGFKLGKEEIVGVMKALQLYVDRDEEKELARLGKIVERVAEEADQVRGLEAWHLGSEATGRVPVAEIRVDPDETGIDAFSLIHKLRKGKPPIYVRSERAEEGMLVVNPSCLKEEEIEILGKRLQELITA